MRITPPLNRKNEKYQTPYYETPFSPNMDIEYLKVVSKGLERNNTPISGKYESSAPHEIRTLAELSQLINLLSSPERFTNVLLRIYQDEERKAVYIDFLSGLNTPAQKVINKARIGHSLPETDIKGTICFYMSA